jgi:hypothetical protein
LLQGAVWELQRRNQPPLHIQQHPLLVGVGLDRLDDEPMLDRVEEFLDVQIQQPVLLPAPLATDLQRMVR